MLEAALLDDVQLRVVSDRALDEARQAGQLERREVLAGEEADEVGGREDGLAVDQLHVSERVGPSCHRSRTEADLLGHTAPIAFALRSRLPLASRGGSGRRLGDIDAEQEGATGAALAGHPRGHSFAESLHDRSR